MKTLHDYLEAMWVNWFTTSPFTIDMQLTTCGRMICISADMIYGGKY